MLVLVLCDAIFAGPPLPGALDRFSTVAVLLGSVATSVYIDPCPAGRARW